MADGEASKQALLEFCRNPVVDQSGEYDEQRLRELADQALNDNPQDDRLHTMLKKIGWNDVLVDFTERQSVEVLQQFANMLGQQTSSIPEFVGITFCPECNMLYPEVDDVDRKLYYVCRSCTGQRYRESAKSNCVFVNRTVRDIQALTYIIEDVTSDPTLPHTAGNMEILCPNCAHNDAVFFQTPFNREKSNMKLFFVCCKCHHKWTGAQNS